jgi:hypothetical protein
MHTVRLLTLYLFAWSMVVSPLPAMPVPADGLAQIPPRGGFQILRVAECSQRIGPFATQTTAWQRWRAAKALGYSVSNGVVPCYVDWTRGYCFNIFYSC